MSKVSAARRIQTSYRRYRQGSDKRQLGAVIRSYRKANPYQIQPSAGRTVSFWRKTELNLTINQQLGFQSAGFSLNFGFSLGFIYGYLNGVYTYSPGIPSSAEFQALFDYYKINAVKLQMFFTANAGALNNGTIGMPVLLIANDFDDVTESMSFSSMFQRVGCRHVQFDANNVNGIVHYIKPKPSGTVQATDQVTGATTTASVAIPFGSTWINTQQSNVVHNGVKILYDQQGLTTNANLGNITFVFDVEFVFKGYR